MEYLIPISILLFSIVGAWAVHRVGRKNNLTISQHVAKSHITQIVFGVVGTVATLLASWSLFSWLLPQYQANFLHYALYGLIMLGFLIAAIVPHIKDTRKGSIHNIAAWGMCYIIPLAMVATLFLATSNFVRILGIILFVASIVLLILFATRKELRRSMLLFQTAYLAIFFVFLVLFAYFY